MAAMMFSNMDGSHHWVSHPMHPARALYYINSSSTNNGLLESVSYIKYDQFQLNPFYRKRFNTMIDWFDFRMSDFHLPYNSDLSPSAGLFVYIHMLWETMQNPDIKHYKTPTSALHLPKCESPAKIVPNMTKSMARIGCFFATNSLCASTFKKDFLSRF